MTSGAGRYQPDCLASLVTPVPSIDDSAHAELAAAVGHVVISPPGMNAIRSGSDKHCGMRAVRLSRGRAPAESVARQKDHLLRSTDLRSERRPNTTLTAAVGFFLRRRRGARSKGARAMYRRGTAAMYLARRRRKRVGSAGLGQPFASSRDWRARRLTDPVRPDQSFFYRRMRSCAARLRVFCRGLTLGRGLSLGAALSTRRAVFRR